jgi:hypothetical protein
MLSGERSVSMSCHIAASSATPSVHRSSGNQPGCRRSRWSAMTSKSSLGLCADMARTRPESERWSTPRTQLLPSPLPRSAPHAEAANGRFLFSPRLGGVRSARTLRTASCHSHDLEPIAPAITPPPYARRDNECQSSCPNTSRRPAFVRPKSRASLKPRKSERENCPHWGRTLRAGLPGAIRPDRDLPERGCATIALRCVADADAL